VDKSTPLCLLLLPTVLEELPFATRAQDLLRAPAVVAVEPSRVRSRRMADAVAATQARRLAKKLPGTPRVVAILHPEQYPLARAIIGRSPDCELWYGPTADPGDDPTLADLHHLADERAILGFDAAPPAPGQGVHQANEPLWSRLEALGVAQR
jgi:hypothetical protein